MASSRPPSGENVGLYVAWDEELDGIYMERENLATRSQNFLMCFEWIEWKG